jgi:hypothetical protein
VCDANTAKVEMPLSNRVTQIFQLLLIIWRTARESPREQTHSQIQLHLSLNFPQSPSGTPPRVIANVYKPHLFKRAKIAR